eukprot:COSAG01_NODE_623_length_14742_cov_22.391177_6_plen_167_part_00
MVHPCLPPTVAVMVALLAAPTTTGGSIIDEAAAAAPPAAAHGGSSAHRRRRAAAAAAAALPARRQPHFALSIDQTAGVALPTSCPQGNFSIRHTTAITWRGSAYIYADIVPDNDPYFPDSYSSAIGAFSSPNGTSGPWNYHGIVLPKGNSSKSWDNGTPICPGAAT